ncbi:hypothetical protein M5X05_20270 [Paenibacillus alvei]|uniref:hypothetical protein n=1 Tax=Paenibacillus alvei TaxID=44250 RepID=UPI0002F7177E|nr:hypothetical protein [Paenibacillus alvei]MCY9706503.1 hypothetical protein [Paenibacillus alvei]
MNIHRASPYPIVSLMGCFRLEAEVVGQQHALPAPATTPRGASVNLGNRFRRFATVNHNNGKYIQSEHIVS